jgi:hypothetical protein
MSRCYAPSPQDHNIDCFSLPEEFDALLSNPNIHPTVKAYAAEKKAELLARNSGNTAEAEKHRNSCNHLYTQIPEPFQW